MSHSSSWTPAACELEDVVSEESEEEDPDRWFDERGREWWNFGDVPGRWYLLGSKMEIFWDEPG